MELAVFWTAFAKNKLNDIFNHYKYKSKSINVARKHVDSIVAHTTGLEKQPFIGQLEELLLSDLQGLQNLAGSYLEP